MSGLISYQFGGGIVTLTLNNGRANAVSSTVTDVFSQAFDQALQGKAVVIVTGQPGILSGGYDLKAMTSDPENAVNLVAADSTLVRRLLPHPYPVIATCPGHAAVKGALLLLSAGYRIGIGGPLQIDLNKVIIDMTMYHVGIELARDRLCKLALARLVASAEMLSPATVADAGLLGTLVSADQLQESAHAAAQQSKKLGMTAHYNIKLKVCKALLETLDQAIELDKKHLDQDPLQREPG